jgi:hypothetical protein
MYEGPFVADDTAGVPNWPADGEHSLVLPDPAEVAITLDDAAEETSEEDLSKDRDHALGTTAITISEERGDDADESGGDLPYPGPDAEPIGPEAVAEEGETIETASGAGGSIPPIPPAYGTFGEFDDEGRESTTETLADSRHILIVSKTHPLGEEKTREIAQQLTDEATDWRPVPHIRQFPDRAYYADNIGSPTILVKFTRIADYRDWDRRSAQSEMEMADKVSSIANSDPAQEVVRSQGYAGIDHVRPIAAAIHSDTGTEKVAYPWQEGRSLQEQALNLPDDEADAAIAQLDTLADGLLDVFQAHGVMPQGIHTDILMVDDSNRLHLVEAEGYEDIDPGSPAYAPGEVRRYQDDSWQPGADPQYAEFNVEGDIYVDPGVIMTARAAEEGPNPILKTFIGEGRGVTVTNAFTGEAVLIPLLDREMSSLEGGRALSRAMEQVSSLATQGAIGHVIAPTDFESSSTPDQAWTNELKAQLAQLGVRNVKVVDGRGEWVHLHVATGRVKTEHRTGKPGYDYQPLPPQSPPAMPHSDE